MMTFFLNVKQHVALNIKIYAIIFIAFTVGALVAAFSVFNLSESQTKELMLYLGDYFDNINKSGADKTLILKISVLDNLKACFLAVMFALMVIGAPFIVLICAAGGYTAFFTLILLFKCYGIKAILFFLTGLLPHWIILLPLYGFFLADCLKFSLAVLNGAKNKRQAKSVGAFLLTAFIVFLCSACASLLCAYVEPWLVSFVAKFYIV